jgi:polysaccharide export outer membrane protein
VNAVVRVALAIVTFVSIAGCAGNNRLEPRPELQTVQQGELPTPTSADAVTSRAFTLGPLDKIEVAVYGIAELSKTVQIDGDGKVSLPLVGTITAAGRTPQQLSSDISDRLRQQYVRNPDVAVTLDTNSQTITVDGAVQRPGMYPVLNRMSLMRAIASGGGITDFADTNYVVVFREVDGKKYAGLYDLRAIRQGSYDDPRVYPNDVVVVGDTPGRRIFQTFLQAGGLLVGPLIAILN